MALYRHTVKFMSDTSTDDSLDPSYQDRFCGIPASIVPKGGNEVYRGVQLQAQTNNVIEMRWFAGALPNMVIEDEVTGIRYLVNRMLNVNGRDREWLIEATEVVV